ncbi:MAG TPA: glycosyltransferase family 2 protein [Opitutaceae bacterium]|nr:glycosyltransferase family 2 protein [Opitutaceae bacterium]
MTPLPDQPTLSVIVPIYNEIATAREALSTILGKQVDGWKRETIIVESNSTDGTRDIVREFSAAPGVRIIYEDAPRGKGHAVRAGLAAATGDVILIQDGDSEYDVNDYDRLLVPLKSGERTFVLGSRHGEGGWAIRKFSDQPLHALMLNLAHWSFTFLIDASLFVWLKDPFTMYKVFRRDCLQGITLKCNRFDLDWELLIKLIRAGHRPIEIPISYRSRSFKEGKKISIFRDPLTWLVAWAKSRFGPL